MHDDETVDPLTALEIKHHADQEVTLLEQQLVVAMTATLLSGASVENLMRMVALAAQSADRAVAQIPELREAVPVLLVEGALRRSLFNPRLNDGLEQLFTDRMQGENT